MLRLDKAISAASPASTCAVCESITCEDPHDVPGVLPLGDAIREDPGVIGCIVATRTVAAMPREIPLVPLVDVTTNPQFRHHVKVGVSGPKIDEYPKTARTTRRR